MAHMLLRQTVVHPRAYLHLVRVAAKGLPQMKNRLFRILTMCLAMLGEVRSASFAPIRSEASQRELGVFGK